MRAVQAVTVAAAGLLLLLSFNYFEPLHLGAKGGYERAASSFSMGALNDMIGTPAAAKSPAPSSLGAMAARIADLEGAMRRAAMVEDFDEAKRIKLQLDALRGSRGTRPAAQQTTPFTTNTPAVTSAAATVPTREAASGASPPLLPILTERKPAPPTVAPVAVETAGSLAGLPGCLVGAWSSVWLVHPNGSRSFLPDAPADCKGRATPSDVGQIPKNEGQGRVYELKGAEVAALACTNRPCPSGPISAPGTGSGAELSSLDASCVLGALRATPSPPVVVTSEQNPGSFALSRELVAQYASPARQIIVRARAAACCAAPSRLLASARWSWPPLLQTRAASSLPPVPSPSRLLPPALLLLLLLPFPPPWS